MCCSLLEQVSNGVADWGPRVVMGLILITVAFLFVYGTLAMMELVKCAVTGKKPTLTSQYGWSNAGRTSAFFEGFFGLSMIATLLTSPIPKVACCFFVAIFVNLFLMIVFLPPQEN